jgi:hypothetical protein
MAMWAFIARNRYWLASCTVLLFGGMYLVLWGYEQWSIRAEVRRLQSLSFREKYEEIKMGMTKSEVWWLLGKPAEIYGRSPTHCESSCLWTERRDVIEVGFNWDGLARYKNFWKRDD